ncbi:MAG: hypothetical protein ACREBR_02000 [bacterium]
MHMQRLFTFEHCSPARLELWNRKDDTRQHDNAIYVMSSKQFCCDTVWISLQRESITCSALIKLYNEITEQLFGSENGFSQLNCFDIPITDAALSCCLVEEMKAELQKLVHSRGKPLLLGVNNVWAPSDLN